MSGRRTFRQKNQSSIFFGDNPPEKTLIDHHYSTPREHIGKSSNDSFRSLQRRINHSMDNAEAIYKERIVNKITDTNQAKVRKQAEQFSFGFPESFYDKFINKPKIKPNDNTVRYEITKDYTNTCIDIHTIKKSLNSHGINVYKIEKASGLFNNPTKIVFSVREEDTKSTMFKRIKDGFTDKGLSMTPRMTRNVIKKDNDLFPNKSEWTDAKYFKNTISMDSLSYKNERNDLFTKDYCPNLKYKNGTPLLKRKAITRSGTRCNTSISVIKK